MAEEKKDLIDEEAENNEEVEDQNESGKAGSSDNKGSESKGNESNKPAGKTFTQEQVNRMMAREKNQGRNAAYKELGIDPKDTKMVNMFKAFVESQKTEDQKAVEKQNEDQRAIEEANNRALIAEAKAEAMTMGVKAQYVEDIVTLALSKLTEDGDLKTIIGEFKTKYPVWFGVEEEDKDDKGSKTGQKGTGSSVKSADKTKKGEENKGLGQRLAAQRRGNGKKSSYWGKNK